jgi:hypothetical protein
MELKGKPLTLAAKLLAIVFVITMTVLKILFSWSVSIMDIIAVGTFIAFAFGSVDASMLTKNIKGNIQ